MHCTWKTNELGIPAGLRWPLLRIPIHLFLYPVWIQHRAVSNSVEVPRIHCQLGVQESWFHQAKSLSPLHCSSMQRIAPQRYSSWWSTYWRLCTSGERLSTACGCTSIHSAGYVHKLFVKSVKERSELFGFLLGAKILQSPVAIISLCSQGHSAKPQLSILALL